MSEFKKYIRIENIGNSAVAGLMDIPCAIQPKMDGANASIWLKKDGTLGYGSRNFSMNEPGFNLKGFGQWVEDNKEKLIKFLEDFNEKDEVILYGEWMIPHTIKGYLPSVWNQFYIFDLLYDGQFIHYDVFSTLMEISDLHYIPIIGSTDKIKVEEAWENCTWMMQEGHKHEGVVIKNPDFINKFGFNVHGKYVPERLMDIARERKGRMIKISEGVEFEICKMFLTDHFLDKELSKIKVKHDVEQLETRHIAEALGRLWNTFITEEIWEILKKFHNPIIDFGKLKRLVEQDIKEKFGL